MTELWDPFCPIFVASWGGRGGLHTSHSVLQFEDVDMSDICPLPAFDFSSTPRVRPFAKRFREDRLPSPLWVKQEQSLEAAAKRPKHFVNSTLIKVLVKLLDGKIAVFSVDPSQSISGLKQWLLETRGVTPDHAQFFYRGSLLRDTDSWAELRFESGALVRQLPMLDKHRIY
jgi:hypothetical protein